MLKIWKWKILNFQVNFLDADKKYICPLIFALPTTHFVISLLLELTTTVIFRSTLSPIVLASAVSVARRSLLSLRTLFSPFDNKRVSRTRGVFYRSQNYAHFRSHSFERVAPIRSGALPIRSGLSSKTLPRCTSAIVRSIWTSVPLHTLLYECNPH